MTSDNDQVSIHLPGQIQDTMYDMPGYCTDLFRRKSVFKMLYEPKASSTSSLRQADRSYANFDISCGLNFGLASRLPAVALNQLL